MSIHICDHCGKPIPDDASVCPHCGKMLGEEIRLTRIPETIEELEAFCAEHSMPLDAMRFFIGENFKGAKAFGIYKDENGDCVVYKNKADGSRAIRYKGPDEKHAVREIYDKLKSETELRNGGSGRTASERSVSDKPMKPWEMLLGAIFLFWKPTFLVLAAAFLIYSAATSPKRGYYRYQDETYYYQNSDWYWYDVLSDGWELAYSVPDELEESYEDYYDGKYYGSDTGQFGATDFEDSDYYESDWDFSSDSSYDDYDWSDSDFSSWDSFDTDWDSDW
jgi:hypothetical protein